MHFIYKKFILFFNLNKTKLIFIAKKMINLKSMIVIQHGLETVTAKPN